MSEQEKLLVVVGATGTQGSAVVNSFLDRESPYKIRGLTRDVGSRKARSLIERGVEMVQANLNDLQSLQVAFAGANAIFAYTDFAGAVFSAEAKELLVSGKASSSTDAGGRVEIQQGKNIVDAAAAIGSTLERFLWSTTPDVDKLSDGKYTGIREMQSKASVLKYIETHPGLEGKWSAIMFGIFTENIVRFPEIYGWTKRLKTPLKAATEYAMRLPVKPAASIPWIDMRRDAGSWVATLLGLPTGTILEAVSGYLNFDEVAAVLTEALKTKVEVEEISIEEYAHEDKTTFFREVALLHQCAAEHGIRGGNPRVSAYEDVSAWMFYESLSADTAAAR